MTRVLSAAALVAVLVSAVWLGPDWATLAIGLVASAFAATELVSFAGVPRTSVLAIVAATSAACATWALATGNDLAAILVAALIVAGAAVLASGGPSPSAIPAAALTAMAPLYVGLPIGVLVWVESAHGREALALPIVIVAVSDTAQYYTGRAFGRRKLAPLVSPAKTVEGAIGGLVVAAAVGALLAPSWIRLLPAAGAVLGLLLALAGMQGDLFESFLKRSAGVKDSSSLIPGHGGVLDRIDSHLFAAPLYYLFLRYLW
jgi:phosphatidate cytidylyltransferase